MKQFLMGAILCQLAVHAHAQENLKLQDTALLSAVEINSVRASDKTPVTKTTLSKQELEKNNIGQDLPFILSQTPAVVVNSDAGNGIGYTGIRIRGTESSRINVTLNGIPYNDAESQGTFFVDLPDITSSASSIQIQRGVGTSSNGAGAFGGSININSNENITRQAIQFSSNAGSYQSFRNTLQFNSGLLKKHLLFDARLSAINSNGYIERAKSKLYSLYGSVAYVNDKNSLRFNVISGKEKTYQAWNGIDEATLAVNRRYNSAGTEKPGTPYDNETDNYVQSHYQLFYNRKLDANWKANLAVFLTNGKGYYEEYRAEQPLENYGLPLYIKNGDTTSATDLVRRLWLDNHFYGTIFSAQYERANTTLIIGSGINQYDGKHFGEIIRAIVQPAVPVNYRYYQLSATKKDYSGYAKWTEQISKHWISFIDLQARAVNYSLFGFKDNPSLTVKNNYFFFNPKAGISWIYGQVKWYASYGRAAKEPNRDDYETGKTQQPVPEKLDDYEMGIEFKNKIFTAGLTGYYMKYKDQLVLTGKINDVGAYTRTNIPDSYRAGLEFSGSAIASQWLSVNGNFCVSENKIKNFTEYLDDYDNGGQQVNVYKKTSIAFSPSVTALGSVNIKSLENMELNLVSRYVGRQFLDNTAKRSRSLHPYFLEDMRISYNWLFLKGKQLNVFVQANNVFSKKYEPSGYSFSYIYGGAVTTENFYYPMAPFNMMAGLSIKL